MDIENVTESRKILIQSSGNHWSDQYRSSYGNFMLGNQSSFDRRYGTGAYKLAIEVYLNPDARNQWMSGSVSLDKGFWMESTRSYGDSEWHGFSSSRNQLTGVEVINKFVRFNGTSGRVEGGNSLLNSLNSINTILGTISGVLSGNYGLTANHTYIYAIRQGERIISAQQLNAMHYAQSIRIAGVLGRVNIITGSIGVAYSTNQAISDYNEGGWNQVNPWDVGDAFIGAGGVTVGGLAMFGLVSNPVGWGVGIGLGLYFGGRLLYDLSNDN